MLTDEVSQVQEVSVVTAHSLTMKNVYVFIISMRLYSGEILPEDSEGANGSQTKQQ